MKKFVIVLSFGLAGGSLFLTGCSKSRSSDNSANANASSPTAAAPASASAPSTAVGGPRAAGPVEIKVKWEAGKQYNMQMVMDTAIDMNVGGRPVGQEKKITQDFHYAPLKQLDNNANLVRVEFDHQIYETTQNGATFKIDTAKNASDDADNPLAPVAAGIRATLGVPLDYTIAADGAVQKIDGLDNFTNAIIAAVPNEQQRTMIADLYDADTLKDYGDFSDVQPGHPINVGDTWTTSKTEKTPAGDMTINDIYTFKNWEEHDGHNCMHLLISGAIKSNNPSGGMVDGATVKVEGGSTVGEGWFDPDLGTFVEINSDNDLTLDISTQQMAITQHMKRNVDVALLGVTAAH